MKTRELISPATTQTFTTTDSTILRYTPESAREDSIPISVVQKVIFVPERGPANPEQDIIFTKEQVHQMLADAFVADSKESGKLGELTGSLAQRINAAFGARIADKFPLEDIMLPKSREIATLPPDLQKLYRTGSLGTMLQNRLATSQLNSTLSQLINYRQREDQCIYLTVGAIRNVSFKDLLKQRSIAEQRATFLKFAFAKQINP